MKVMTFGAVLVLCHLFVARNDYFRRQYVGSLAITVLTTAARRYCLLKLEDPSAWSATRSTSSYTTRCRSFICPSCSAWLITTLF
ncbi:hypothetical protein BDZ89DRAFT_273788 [Hymenopellis radicata]|nr:hypothetical protein BDZ89DRAFT_273788 [Hymenopellis radicata]